MDPYVVLGLKRGASLQEIKAAYREKVLKVHPDVQLEKTKDAASEAATRFQEVTAAYEVLTSQDPEVSQHRYARTGCMPQAPFSPRSSCDCSVFEP
mmetsp:Transcript_32443/g.54442  ORF Transcript_32443/g.54442 Transcript_32443/m.54442 type:complete len:96 (+) Transcript_32443:129-416(+)